MSPKNLSSYFGLFMTTLLITMIVIATLFLLICTVTLCMGIFLNIRARRRRARQQRAQEDVEGQSELPVYSDERPRGLLAEHRNDESQRYRDEEAVVQLPVVYLDEPPEYVESIDVTRPVEERVEFGVGK